ncbi:hypothetical protein N24_0493 [Corynebacterium suranareeae]|uniref:O-antigen polymerase n=1 Tax=Corynebacterium suranareeae TaxID=2506452 RepID=A0A160PNB9_9CORY|nr:hypothetical protein [Corynebacterium suranareeae]BAU94755.1 hypothetical protein N24_0493 [Corynebacterium suranareeae]
MRSAKSDFAEPVLKTPLRDLFLICVVFAFLISLIPGSPFIDVDGIVYPGVVLALLSLVSFFACGQKQINASSVTSYAILVFIGFPAIYGGFGFYESGKNYTPWSLLIVVILAFVLQLFILVLSSTAPRESNITKSKLTEKSKISGALTIATAMLLGTFAAQVLGFSIGAAGFSWLSILFASAVLFLEQGKLRQLFAVALMIVVFAMEFGADLGGFGRLNLAVLAISVATVASFGIRKWWIKAVTVILTGPALMFLVEQRVAFLESSRGVSVDDSEGIGSVVGPFHSAGTIVNALLQGQIGLDWGATFFAAAMVWVPRRFWPDKPIGFGREIVEVTQPYLISSKGYSDAGTFIGEAVWNFGIGGAVLLLVLFSFMLVKFDKLVGKQAFKTNAIDNIVQSIFFVVVIAGFINVIWGGLFTTTTRLLFPVALLLIIGVIIPKSRVSREQSTGRQPSIENSI